MSMALTKIDIVKSIREQIGYSRKQGEHLVETILEKVKSSLESGEDVMISGFGKFCVRIKKQRRGRNPNTGGSLAVRPRRVVTFRCSGQYGKTFWVIE
jgi:integration host factor subunit alpha